MGSGAGANSDPTTASSTFNFLTQIPWTPELRQIPEIARAHHEKLNGKGYPYKLRDDEIPVPAKIMTICDIFDALVASDRPYKRAVPVERALSVLEELARKHELDGELFRLFVEAKIFELTAPGRPQQKWQTPYPSCAGLV